MVEFSLANAADFFDEEHDEEPGEEIESAPPLNIGEEREISSSGIKKKLIKHGISWETPEVGDEVTVHFEGKLLEGTKFTSTRDKSEPFTFKIGTCHISGLNHAIVTMRKGEIALFTIPPELGYGAAGSGFVPPNSFVEFEVELVSWIPVVDVCKDGGIIKRVMEKGEQIGPPGDLDEVRVKYTVMHDDGTVVAKTPEEGLEFHVRDGHFCPALPKAIKTMKMGEKVELTIQPQYAFEEQKDNSGSSLLDMNSTLRIDLELLSFKPVIDVSGDSKILKKILKEGEGSFTANEGASVSVRYTAMLEDGTVFEKKGVDAGEPMKFVTDEEHVIAGLDRAAITMKKGEIALLTIHPEYGFGSIEVQRDMATVPPSSTIIYEIEMLDFTREKAPWEMSDQERLEAASRKKEEGNLLFKNEKYQRAGKKYEKAVDYVAEDGSFGDNDLKLVKSLRVVCWLNSAACSLKVNDFQEAIKQCSKVLDVESSNVKALYRRAQAYMGAADLHLAELDIKKALETDPRNREVRMLKKNLRQLKAESNKRDTELYSTMLSGKGKGATPATKERPNVEEYAIKTPDYSMHFIGGGPFSSRKEVVDWAKQVAAQFNMFLITARAKKDIVSIVCERYGTSRCKGKKHTDTSNVDVVEESPVDAVDYNLMRKSRSKKCHCPFSLRGVEKRGRWVLKVTKGFHNHDLEDNGYGYRVGGKLTETQMQTVAILMRNHLKPKEIFEHIKMADPNTQSTMTNIYNACYKLRSQGLVEGNNMAEENKAVQADEENQNVGTSEMEKGVAYISQDALGDEDSELLHKCFQEISSMPPDERRRWTKRLQEMLHSEKSPVQDPKACLNSKKRDYLALENTESTRSSAPKFSGSSDSSPSHGKKTKKSLLPSLPEAKPHNQPGNNAPLFFLPYITDWLDMARDGNCGYRAVAHTIYGDEKFWVRVRMELFRELGDRGDLYAKLFGGMDRVRETLHSIMHWEGPAPNNKWMTMFDMGWVIATKYNVLCVSISRHQCVSYLPLIAPDGVEFISRTIVVGYIQEEHHFMLINPVDDFPLPPILNGWYNSADGSVFGWDATLITRFNRWLEFSRMNWSIL